MLIFFYDDCDGMIWYDGFFVFWRDVNLYVFSYGFYYGSMVFEGECVYGGKVFKFCEYINWLINFVKIMGYEILYIVDEIDVVCYDVIKV